MTDTTNSPDELTALLAERVSIRTAMQSIEADGQRVDAASGVEWEGADYAHLARRLAIVESRIVSLRNIKAGIRLQFTRI